MISLVIMTVMANFIICEESDDGGHGGQDGHGRGHGGRKDGKKWREMMEVCQDKTKLESASQDVKDKCAQREERMKKFQEECKNPTKEMEEKCKRIQKWQGRKNGDGGSNANSESS